MCYFFFLQRHFYYRTNPFTWSLNSLNSAKAFIVYVHNYMIKQSWSGRRKSSGMNKRGIKYGNIYKVERAMKNVTRKGGKEKEEGEENREM